MDTAVRAVVQGNSEPQGRAALETVLKLVNNILKAQSEPKFRTLRTGNAKIRAQVMDATGGPELLHAAGFEPVPGTPETLVVPMEADLVRLMQARQAIHDALSAGWQQGMPLAAAPTAAPPAREPPPPASRRTAPPLAQPASAPAAAPSDQQARAAERLRALFAQEQAVDGDANAAAARAMDRLAREQLPGQPAAPGCSSADGPHPMDDDAADELQAALAMSMDASMDMSVPVDVCVDASLEASRDGGRAEAPRPADLLSRDGFEKRVKALFAEEQAAGAEPNAAAARALSRSQGEQLAAAAAKRGRASSHAPASPAAAEPMPAAAAPALESRDSGGLVSFERLEDVEKVAQEQVDAINALYHSDGIVFVDPTFPPIPRSLYMHPEGQTTFRCTSCSRRSPLPRQATREELISMKFGRDAAGVAARQRTLACAHCGTPHLAMEFAVRPVGWERASATPPQGIVDDTTLQFSSVPWVVFRGDPRPEDIRQGSVGNCWFVCALSALAEKPETIRRILLTREFNRAGAYQVRLCLAGEWHTVLIDDVLPVDALQMVAYLKPARRQLWGPLIEKAAAKLHASYEALSGGTFAEAFSMLTGFPVQRILLPCHPAMREPKPLPADAGDGDRASHAKAVERWRTKCIDSEELFAQLYSFRQSEYPIGASTFAGAGDEALHAEMKANGLQCPHAYSVMAVATVGPEATELVKLRNPNGVALWKGRWSKHSSEWTYDTKQEVGLNREDEGVFWMAWDDFYRLFAEVCVCRLVPELMEGRETGWLASVFNAGQAVTLEVYARANVEVTLHQEPHASRGADAAPTLVDIGLAILKVEFDGSYSIVAYAERCMQQNVHVSTSLEQDGHTANYLAVPLCFGHMRSAEPRKFRLAVHSTQPLSLERVTLTADAVATTIIKRAVAEGEKMALLKSPALGDVLNIYTLDEEAGRVIVAENTAPFPMRVEWDSIPDVSGFTSSRGLFMCQDVLPPRSRQLLVALSVDMRVKATRLGYGFGGGSHEGGAVPPSGLHIPDLDDLGQLRPLHEPQPMDPSHTGGFTRAPAAPPPAAAPFGDPTALANLIRGFGGAPPGR